MIVVMKDAATEAPIETVSTKLKQMGFDVHQVNGVNRTILGVIGDPRQIDSRDFEVEMGLKYLQEAAREQNMLSVSEVMEVGAIDQGFTKSQMKACLTQADLVFLCTPIS